MFKVIIYISLILAVVIIPSFFGGMFKLAREKKDAVNPSPSPSPIRYLGWPEYRNDTYHYKLKYPYDWLLLNQVQLSPELVTWVNLKTENYQEKPHVTFSIKAENFTGAELTDYPEIKQLLSSGREPRKLTVSQSPALFFGGLGETGELALTFILHRNNVFRLGWDQTQIGLITPHKDKMLQMIASFEFID